MFAWCSNLKTVNFSDSIRNISNGSFARCVSLESIEIPGQVQKIGNNAFSSCPHLTTVCSKCVTPPEINSNTFDDNTKKNGTLLVPEGSEADYRQHPYWKEFYHIYEGDITENLKELTSNGSFERNEEEWIYDLQGRKVRKNDDLKNTPAGIYIINGKKIVIK